VQGICDMMSARPILKIRLEEILAGAQLHALRQSGIPLLQLAQDPTTGPTEFAVPIESDPGLACQVLRFVNSSFFGFAEEISSIRLAIALVGMRTIKHFILWSAVFSMMPDPQCGPFDLKTLWQDSLRRALFARLVARLLGVKEAEEAFSAALLQDIAVPLLAKELPDVYATLLTALEERRLRLSTLERYAFGWTHAQAAAIVARQWRLPDGLAFLIENHTADPGINGPCERNPLLTAVAMSALLPAVTDPMWHDAGALEEICSQVRPAGSLVLPDLLTQVDREFAGFAPVMKISLPKKSLVDCYAEVTAVAEA